MFSLLLCFYLFYEFPQHNSYLFQLSAARAVVLGVHCAILQIRRCCSAVSAAYKWLFVAVLSHLITSCSISSIAFLVAVCRLNFSNFGYLLSSGYMYSRKSYIFWCNWSVFPCVVISHPRSSRPPSTWSHTPHARQRCRPRPTGNGGNTRHVRPH